MSVYLDKFKARCAEIKKQDEPISVVEAGIEVPVAMKIPCGESVYSVFKRSVKGHNQPMLMSLTLDEAKFWTSTFNAREQKRRREQPGLSEEPMFYDFVKEKSDEESLYYNVRPVTKPEGSDPSQLEIIKNDVQEWI